RISVGEQKYVSFDEYQRLHAELRKKMCLLDWRLPESIVKPTNEFILRSIENGERNYTFVE
ncbi:MAG: hypothetical protein KQA33_01575, partial [Candidatus Aenigmarchaeota archaeon]|nr:hypothetical protein [Candidatus Aenigmarchaeota archaeon]